VEIGITRGNNKDLFDIGDLDLRNCWPLYDTLKRLRFQHNKKFCKNFFPIIDIFSKFSRRPQLKKHWAKLHSAIVF